jgi:hypothetical protein
MGINALVDKFKLDNSTIGRIRQVEKTTVCPFLGPSIKNARFRLYNIIFILINRIIEGIFTKESDFFVHIKLQLYDVNVRKRWESLD